MRCSSIARSERRRPSTRYRWSAPRASATMRRDGARMRALGGVPRPDGALAVSTACAASSGRRGDPQGRGDRATRAGARLRLRGTLVAGSRHDDGSGDDGDGNDRCRKPPRARLARTRPSLVEGGEDLVRVRDRRRLGRRRGGIFGARDANVEVIVRRPEPVERVVEDLGESLRHLDRSGAAAGVVALDRLERELAAIGELLLGQVLAFASDPEARFGCGGGGGTRADHLVRAPFTHRWWSGRGGADRRGVHSTSCYAGMVTVRLPRRSCACMA